MRILSGMQPEWRPATPEEKAQYGVDPKSPLVIGKGGETMKRIATEARQDMERLFDGKVFLEIFVKVKSGWADDEKRLKSYGYE